MVVRVIVGVKITHLWCLSQDLTLTSCVTLGKLSELQFPHEEWGLNMIARKNLSNLPGIWVSNQKMMRPIVVIINASHSSTYGC